MVIHIQQRFAKTKILVSLNTMTNLSSTEVRVLGSLVEKEITTPDYYPLSLNALTNACNQSSNRNPVVHFDEETVEQALDTLRQKNLIHVVQRGDSRITKYRHVLYETLDLGAWRIRSHGRPDASGPQTIGELYRKSPLRLADLEQVEGTLNHSSDVNPLSSFDCPGRQDKRKSALLTC
jgi:uncharacterized protein YceH (UPF0502 family)